MRRPALRGGRRRGRGDRRVALAAGPAAYSVATAGRALNGNNVLAGPASVGGGMGGFGGPPSGGGGGGRAEAAAWAAAR